MIEQLYLPISSESLAAPSLASLASAAITGIMLWPDDMGKQRQMVEVAENKVFLEQIEIMAAEQSPLDVAVSLPKLRLLSGGPRLTDMQAQIQVRFGHGVVAGEVLYCALDGLGPDGHVSLGKVKDEIIGRLKPKMKLSRSTMDNSVWQSFRQVSHLWSAYIILASVHEQSARATFPCDVDTLGVFLAIAERLRTHGQQRRLRHAAGKLLDGRIWAVPPDVALPDLPSHKEESALNSD